MKNLQAQRVSATPPDAKQAIFRSGAVARMVGMPVATLRVWEQRYRAVQPATAASGHRLYSVADIERVTVLRRLTEQGHAIGLLAALDTEPMRQLLNEPNESPRDRAPRLGDSAPQQAMRVVVVGQALARRVQTMAQREPKGLALVCVAVFDSLADAAQAAQAAGRSTEGRADCLLWQAGSLQAGEQHTLQTTQTAWHAKTTAVVYRFSNAAARSELIRAGTALLQEPADDESLFQWLTSLHRLLMPQSAAPRFQGLAMTDPIGTPNPLVTAPRFADLGLAEFAGLSSTVACECPAHLAELLLQISHFEKYSGECMNKSAVDAQLHVYLQQVAGSARMLFETALAHVAAAEGLALPQAQVQVQAHHGLHGLELDGSANSVFSPVANVAR